jgi:hypothetical protein
LTTGQTVLLANVRANARRAFRAFDPSPAQMLRRPSAHELSPSYSSGIGVRCVLG